MGNKLIGGRVAEYLGWIGTLVRFEEMEKAEKQAKYNYHYYYIIIINY